MKRRGKFILVDLAPKTLLIHLRMSGDLRVEEMGQPVQNHDRLILNFEDGARLVFNDTRKFGRVWLVDDPDNVVCRLGPDPFDEDLTPQSFHALLHKRHRRIKPLLLDQNFMAGIGNIYSDEALFRAKIHPLSFSDELETSEAGQLLQAIRDVLLEGIERNGASIDWVYKGGSFQNHFQGLPAHRACLRGLWYPHRTDRTWSTQHPFLPNMPTPYGFGLTNMFNWLR